jgi:hypothetical protein
MNQMLMGRYKSHKAEVKTGPTSDAGEEHAAGEVVDLSADDDVAKTAKPASKPSPVSSKPAAGAHANGTTKTKTSAPKEQTNANTPNKASGAALVASKPAQDSTPTSKRQRVNEDGPTTPNSAHPKKLRKNNAGKFYLLSSLCHLLSLLSPLSSISSLFYLTSLLSLSALLLPLLF